MTIQEKFIAYLFGAELTSEVEEFIIARAKQ